MNRRAFFASLAAVVGVCGVRVEASKPAPKRHTWGFTLHSAPERTPVILRVRMKEPKFGVDGTIINDEFVKGQYFPKLGWHQQCYVGDRPSGWIHLKDSFPLSWKPWERKTTLTWGEDEAVIAAKYPKFF